MKYLVTVPIIGYSEYTIEVDDDMDMESIRHGLSTGQIDLDPIGKNPVKEFVLIEDLENFDIPNDWPERFEVTPF